jgi:molybdopterin biosynthesis enzyme MoaB
MLNYLLLLPACSLRYVPTAVLSRQTAGLRGQSLILNLPGKPKSIRETIDEVGQGGVGWLWGRAGASGCWVG